MTLEDITEVLVMGIVNGGLEVPSHAWMRLSAPKISTALSYLISKPNPMVYVYCNEKGSIVGVIAGELTESWLGEAVYATDYALFIRPDYRHKKVGYKLLMHFMDESIRLGAERILTTMPLCNFNGDSMEKLLTRKGFSMSAKTFTKVV